MEAVEGIVRCDNDVITVTKCIYFVNININNTLTNNLRLLYIYTGGLAPGSEWGAVATRGRGWRSVRRGGAGGVSAAGVAAGLLKLCHLNGLSHTFQVDADDAGAGHAVLRRGSAV